MIQPIVNRCSFCSNPLRGKSSARYQGRCWPGQPIGEYCCLGCLSAGEQRQREQYFLASVRTQKNSLPGKSIGKITSGFTKGTDALNTSYSISLDANLIATSSEQASSDPSLIGRLTWPARSLKFVLRFISQFWSLPFRFGVSLVIAGQSMVFSLAINLEEQTDPISKLWIQSGIGLATLLVLVLLGGPLFRGFCRDIRRGILSIESLFVLTLLGALGASLQALLTQNGPIYFEVISILLVVYTFGKIIGAKSRSAAFAASTIWLNHLSSCRRVSISPPEGLPSDDLLPSFKSTADANRNSATLLEEIVPVEQLNPGDLVVIHPGETIAVDGTIESGNGLISESALTGESIPCWREVGNSVYAGSISIDAWLQIRVSGRGSDRRIDRLLQFIRENSESGPENESLADQLARWFTPVISVVAVATFTYWSMSTSWHEGLYNALSVLLVSCPCSIGLAAPIIFWSTRNRLAERGLVVHTNRFLDALARVDHVFLDKTGTVTEERFTILQIQIDRPGEDRLAWFHRLALIEKQIDHPIASAFSDLVATDHPNLKLVAVRSVPGKGIEAELEFAGQPESIRIGQLNWISDHLIPNTDHSLTESDRTILATRNCQDINLADSHIALESVSRENTPKPWAESLEMGTLQIGFSRNGICCGRIWLQETARQSLPYFLEGLKSLDIGVEIVTGDNQIRLPELQGLTAHAQCSPEEKVHLLQAQQENGHCVLMIGDGLNDAPVLARANCSIAMAEGTDLANGSAQLTLYNGDLSTVPWAIEMARTSQRLIQRNILRALLYNITGITLAAMGFLHPIVAALLMIVSSLLLIWSSVTIGVPTEPSDSSGHCSSSKNHSGSRFFHLPCWASRIFSLLSRKNPPSSKRENWFSSQLRRSMQTARERPHLLWSALLLWLGIITQMIPVVAIAEIERSAIPWIFAGGLCLSFAILVLWFCWESLPHWLDMSIAMFAWGNWGMYFGWWGDRLIAPDSSCCCCLESIWKLDHFWSGMWLGMSICGNLAMWLFQRRKHSELPYCFLAMFTGGNVGMIAGMILGGQYSQLLLPLPFLEKIFNGNNISLLSMAISMSAGMILGMIIGSELARRLIFGIINTKLKIALIWNSSKHINRT